MPDEAPPVLDSVALLDALAEPAFVIDARGVVRCANARAERLRAEGGAKGGALPWKGERLALPPPPVDGSMAEKGDLALIHRVLEGKADQVEIELSSGTPGAATWVLLATPLGVDGGRGALLRLCDKSANEKREHERRAAQVIDAMQLGVLIYRLADPADDRTLRLIYANPTATKLARVEASTIVGKTLDETFSDARAIGLPQRYVEVIREGRTIEFEDVYPSDSGGIQGAFAAKAFPLAGQCVAVLFEDIYPRKAIEASLISTRRFLDTIIDNIPLAIAVKDGKTHSLVRVNKHYEAFYGTPREQVLGKSNRELFFTAEESDRMMAEDEILAKGNVVEYPEVSLTTPTRGPRIAHSWKMPMPDPEGQTRYILLVFEDITERKKLEEIRLHEHALLETQKRLLEVIRELSTPIIPIHPGILVVPLVGQMDSSRSAQFMETLLGGIQRHRAEVILIDITGVSVVDTAVANQLLQATRAASLLGASCVLVGTSPEVATTMVALEVDFRGLPTHRDLEAGFRYALARKGWAIVERARGRAR